MLLKSQSRMSHRIPIDVSLSIAVYSMKGIYALLLGSGVSRGAGIPTGWEILLDLIRKVAVVQDEKCGPEPTKWYEKTYGRPPNYSIILENLANSKTERQQILYPYFEPNEEEYGKGLKQPTQAHRAIADLVVRGYVRVIVTTNFDRLLEKALDDVGIVPTVITRPEDFDGALPLVHTQCTIVKPNGDYKDTRIKNTPDELAEYDPKFNVLLARILSEFGLIVSGLSGDYDKALVKLLIQVQNPKFSSFWTRRSKLSETASEVVSARRATVIEIESADRFFGELNERIRALEDLLSKEELTAKIAGQRVKRILTEGESKIRLHELVHRQTEALYTKLFHDSILIKDPEPTELLTVIKRLEDDASILLRMLVEGCYWDEEQEYTEIWVKCIERLANPPVTESQYVQYSVLRWYPVVLLLYAAGISAVAHGNYRTLLQLVVEPTAYNISDEKPVFFEITERLLSLDDVLRKIPDFEKSYTPVAHRLFEYLRVLLEPYLRQKYEYARYFARFEFLAALEFAHRTQLSKENEVHIYGHNGYWTWGKVRERWIIDEIHTESLSKGRHWAPLKAGFLDGDEKRYSLIASGLLKQRRD